MFKSLDTAILSILGNMPRRTATDWRKSGENQQKERGKLNLVNKLAPSLKQIWIGLEWDSRVKAFVWYDHSVPTFTKWAPNEPSGKAREPYGHMWTGHEGSSGKIRESYWTIFLFFFYIAIKGTTTALSPNNTRRSIVQALGRSWYYEWRFKVRVPNFGRWKAGCCSVMILWVT